MNLFNLMATLGLDTSEYSQGIDEAKASTKQAVSQLAKEYSTLQKQVNETALKYNEAASSSGEASKEAKTLLTQLQAERIRLSELRQSLNEANNYMNSFKDSSNNAAQSAESFGEALTAAMTKASLLSNAFSSLASKAKEFVVNAVNTGVDYNKQMEQYTVAFTNMLGSAEEAASVLEQIKADAASTPLDTATLVQANQYLISCGVSASDARDTILALGDAVSAAGGSSDELNRMAQNLQQIKNAGSATAADIKQFAYAGIDIYGILADYTGQTTEQVQDMTVTYDLLSAALQNASSEGGRYYDAMNTQSETLAGRMSTLTDNATQLAGELTEDLSSSIGNVVNALAEWVSGVLEDDEKLAALKTTVETVTVAITSLTAAFIAHKAAASIASVIARVTEAYQEAKKADEALTVAQYALNTAMSKNVFVLIATLIAGVVTALATWIATTEEGQKAWSNFCTAAKSAISTAANFIGNCLNEVMSRIKGVAAAISNIKNGASAMAEAYNSAYNNSRSEYKEEQNDKRIKEQGSKRRTSNGGMWSDKTSGSGKTTTSYTPTTSSSSKKSSGSGSSSSSTSETVLSAITTVLSEKGVDALGEVTKSVESLTEKVKTSAGTIKDRVTETTTQTGTEMVNGVATTFKQVTKVVDGVVEKVTKTYDDMSTVLKNTSTETSESTVNGVTTATSTVTKTYADGSKDITTTATTTEDTIVDGVAATVKTVKTYLNGVEQAATQTITKVEQTVSATQTRIDKAISGAKSQLSSGIFGTIKSVISNLQSQDWSGVATNVAQLIWGEVNQDQRESIATWAENALEIINEKYAGGGLKEALQAISNIFTKGIAAGADEASKSVESFASILSKLTSSGGIGGQIGELGTNLLNMLTNVGTSMGNIISGLGSSLAGLASSSSGVLSGIASGLSGVISTVGSFILANPEIAAVLAIIAGIAALGVFIWKKFGSGSSSDSNTSTDTSSSGTSYKDIQDAYWYGNERAFAGYDYRTDPFMFNSNNSVLNSYQSKMQTWVEQISDVVAEYLPQTANQSIVLDDGTIVGATAAAMDAQLGIVSMLAERGN